MKPVREAKFKRRQQFTMNAENRELLVFIIEAARKSHQLLGSLSEARYADPVAEETTVAAYRILGAAVGDHVVTMRVSAWLDDLPDELNRGV